jgi:hypothetical protein
VKQAPGLFLAERIVDDETQAEQFVHCISMQCFWYTLPVLNGVDCEQIFKAQEVNKRMKDKAAHACHALCRSRVVEEIRHWKGTPQADHLKLVLSVTRGRLSD